MLISSRRVRGAIVATATATALSLFVPTGTASAAPASGQATGTGYTNPVSRGFADTFADPAVIRGKDGFWYAYGTTDPLREGEGTRHLLPISRSTDLVNWQYV